MSSSDNSIKDAMAFFAAPLLLGAFLPVFPFCWPSVVSVSIATEVVKPSVNNFVIRGKYFTVTNRKHGHYH
jgi:hypothetical protein